MNRVLASQGVQAAERLRRNADYVYMILGAALQHGLRPGAWSSIWEVLERMRQDTEIIHRAVEACGAGAETEAGGAEKVGREPGQAGIA